VNEPKVVVEIDMRNIDVMTEKVNQLIKLLERAHELIDSLGNN